MEITGVRPGRGHAVFERQTRRVRLHSLSRRAVCLGLLTLWLNSAASTSFAQALPASPLDRGSSETAFVGESVFDLQVEGNVTIPTSAILRHVKTQRNRPVDPLLVKEDVRALYDTRWFFSVEPRFRHTRDGLVLVFKVFERPVVRKVEYRGNDKMKTRHLQSLTNIKPGSPFDIVSNKEAARRIEQTYHEKGFAFATVELESGHRKGDRDVIFRIHEGPKVRVTKIRFEGNEFFSSALLKTKLRTKTAFLSWLGLSFMGGKYDPSTIPDDLASLKQYYHSLGFFDVKIEKDIQFTDDKADVHITYSIDEGTRYEVQKILFEGNRVLSVDDLRDKAKLEEGEFFNVRNLNADVGKMQEQYGELGRLFAKVEAVPRFLEAPGQVDIVYRIDEDRVRMIRRINVHYAGDQPHTLETTLLNRMQIHPGDLANNRMIQRSKARLEGSQLFERGPAEGVRIDIKPVDDGLQLAGHEFRGQSHSSSLPAAPLTSGFGHSVDLGESAAHVNPFGIRPITPRSRSRASVSPAADRRQESPTSERLTPSFQHNSTARPAQVQRVEQTNWVSQAPEADVHMPLPIYAPIVAQTHADELRPLLTEPIFRGQSDSVFDPNNPMYGNSPQGDPLSNIFREPPPAWVDLDVYATEARTGRLMFGVGVNSDAGVVGSIVLDESNFNIFNPPTSWSDVANGRAFRGAGQRFRLELIPGDIVSRYMVTWTEPYFLDTDYSLSLSGFYFNRFYPDWDEDRAGGRIAVGRQLNNFFSVNAALRLEEVTLKNPTLPTPDIITRSIGSSFLSTGRIAAAYDTRDSSFLPSQGHILQVGYEQAFGDFNYPRFDAEARKYFTLMSRPDGTGKHILSVGGELGWSDTGTPVFERFFAGGFQTFRGFEFRGVSPRVGGVEIGGNWMMLGSAEYKLPVTADDSIAFVFFSDVGTVEDKISLDQFRVTVGTGLRLTVPAMGPVPLAFDFAIPLAKQDFDRTRVFSFYIGINR